MNIKRVKTWFLIHKWTSLVSMVFLLMLCITGLPLIFTHEIDHWLHDTHPPELGVANQEHQPLNTIVASANALQPDDVVQFLFPDPDEPDVMYIRLGTTAKTADVSKIYVMDQRTNELILDYPFDSGFMSVMLRLHVDMYAGLPGTLFLGAMGLLLVVSLISGTVLYAPFMKKLSFGTIRRDRSVKIKWLDIHNLLGIVTLVWLLVVSITGVINTLSIPIFSYWQSTQLADMTAPYQSQAQSLNGYGDTAKAVATAYAEEPNKTLSFMAFPGNDFASPLHYVAFMQGDTPLTSKLLTPLLIDAKTGELVDKRELPWYVSALLLSEPLHYGDYGELGLKIVWAILDVIAIIVLISGIYLWLKSRAVSFESWWNNHPGNTMQNVETGHSA